MVVRLISVCLLLFVVLVKLSLADELRIATFAVDASPPIGSPLAYDPTKEITEPLSARGVILLGSGDPIVLCAVDWLGIANAANAKFREQIATAVGTDASRVVVHTLHQHDAPRCDLSAAELLSDRAAAHYDLPLIAQVIDQMSAAASESVKHSLAVESISVGEAEVIDVASNRRLLGPDGQVHTTRYTACKDPAIRELPVGTIDPVLRLITFNGKDGPLAALTFYATHPQSYYRTGQANPDFPGMARNQQQAATGVFHLHFNGAGGNIGAGKFNDGATENRQVLANKMAQGMKQAWENRRPQALATAAVDWSYVVANLPVGAHLNASELQAAITSETTGFAERCNAAETLAFLHRANERREVAMPISRLKLGDVQLLFMPGELFVEYQLSAQAMAPNSTVMLAAYGDYGTAYIGTRAAYGQGGYEVSQRATHVSLDVEEALVNAMRTLLSASDARVLPSDFTERTGSLPDRAPE